MASEFETFHHQESEPLEGGAICLEQEDLSRLVEEINNHIQQSHLLSPTIHQDGSSTVHIVSTESTAGTLRAGLVKSNVVIGFPDDFSIGPIKQIHNEAGKSDRYEWIEDNINFEQEDDMYQNMIRNTLREIEDIPKDIPIYLWYGDNANERTFLLYILEILRNKEHKIYLLHSTGLYERWIGPTKEGQPIFHTSQMDSADIKVLFEKGYEQGLLVDKDRLLLQSEWTALLQTKEVLRIWESDRLESVPENHFDAAIIRTVKDINEVRGTEEFIQVHEIIWKMIEQDREMNPFFLEYRMRDLIYSGALLLKGIPKSMWHYRVKLRE